MRLTYEIFGVREEVPTGAQRKSYEEQSSEELWEMKETKQNRTKIDILNYY